MKLYSHSYVFFENLNSKIMSLTQILKNPGFNSLKNKLKEEFPRPKIVLKGDLIVPPRTENFSIVGAAFDYLLRFQLERKFKNKVVLRDSLVADSVMNGMKAFLKSPDKKKLNLDADENLSKRMINKMESVLNELRKVEKQKSKLFYDATIHLYEKAKNDYNSFLHNGVFTDDLIKSSIVLAKLDLVARAGIHDETINEFNPEDMIDLKHLIAVVPLAEFDQEGNYYLNPTFGKGSSLFLGADADLIIGDTLIDIKTTKKLEINRIQLNQLLCYYVASLIGGINGNLQANPIKKVGIYFSRYGILWKMSLSEFGTDQSFDKFKEWLEDYFKTCKWMKE